MAWPELTRIIPLLFMQCFFDCCSYSAWSDGGRDRDREDDRKDRVKDEKDSKPKSVFEEFNIPRPTLQLNPFTGL